jgi:hypothetical protein
MLRGFDARLPVVASVATAHRSAPAGGPGPLARRVLALQRTAGNRAVARVVGPRRRGAQAHARTLQRIKWDTAKPKPWQNYSDSYEVQYGVTWDKYLVQTDAGTWITVLKPRDGKSFFCHGLTFGGATEPSGPFSIDGAEIPTILKDEFERADAPQAGDVAAFYDKDGVSHTGIVHAVLGGAAEPGRAVTIDSKLGSKGRHTLTLEELQKKYPGEVRYFRRRVKLEEDWWTPLGLRPISEEELAAAEVRERAAGVASIERGVEEIDFLQKFMASLLAGSASSHDAKRYGAIRSGTPSQ